MSRSSVARSTAIPYGSPFRVKVTFCPGFISPLEEKIDAFSLNCISGPGFPYRAVIFHIELDHIRQRGVAGTVNEEDTSAEEFEREREGEEAVVSEATRGDDGMGVGQHLKKTCHMA